MKRFESLINIVKYLKEFSIPSAHAIFVVAEKDATSKLKEISQHTILKVLPAIEQSGGTDQFTNTLSIGFLVLGKIDDTNKTDAEEQDLYLELLEIASELTTKLEYDISSGENILLAGLTLKSIVCSPDHSLFGGWIGWSIDIDFE